MAKGGRREGSGRKPLSQELQSADLARNALIKRYGSLEEALDRILGMGEPGLIKFILEHAFGKAPDKLALRTDEELKIRIIRGNRTSAE